MRYLRTNRASFKLALGSEGDCTAAVWRLMRHLVIHKLTSQSDTLIVEIKEQLSDWHMSHDITDFTSKFIG